MEGVIKHTLGGKKTTALLARQPADYQPFHRLNDLNRLFCAQPLDRCDQSPGVLMPCKKRRWHLSRLRWQLDNGCSCQLISSWSDLSLTQYISPLFLRWPQRCWDRDRASDRLRHRCLSGCSNP